ncbi:hypothetical protein MJD09_04130 [bacterium]|nr:hypothetical protein [bacterium]
MYEDYRDIAEFRIVYISDAHALDDVRSNEIARINNIFEHQDFGQCCSTAEMMMKDKNITIPCIIDNMDNAVEKAYKALPDRLYVVRTDGCLAIAARRGPAGFKPALQETREWLAQFRTSGKEPPLH